jgi:hypothetical protein
MEKGDKIEIIIGSGRYYKAGDKAVLTSIDNDGDWWADFSSNENYYKSGVWCAGKLDKDFKLDT